MRILYGLERLPRTLSADDDRLPAVVVGASPLRLNSQPLPAEAWADDRMAAMRAWLLSGCGDYNGALRGRVTRYLSAIAAHLADHRDELAAGLARFHGLYQPEDWIWSALRPLPRAWWREGDIWRNADLLFWNGNAVVDPAGDELPHSLRFFWRGETLPASPFRRSFP